jgi:hypothetical protein
MFAVLVVSGACAKSAPQVPEDTRGSAGSPAVSRAGSAADGGEGGTTPSSSSDAGIHLPPTGGAPDAGPGVLLTDVSTPGRGACADVSAADVVAAIESAHPELADIPSTREPGVGGDGSFVFSYLRDDGSFAFVVKRGSGDCPAGCIDHEYWYFDVDALCRPQQVGHYSRTDDGTANCYTIEGQPLWGVPAATDAAYVCGEDDAAQSISGTHQFRARGTRMACALAFDAATALMIDQTITIEIEQDPAQLSRGKVTISGLGDAWLDGRALDAEFTRRRFQVSLVENNLPSQCVSQHQLQLLYDFEGFGPNRLELNEVESPDCDPQSSSPSDDYCKGFAMIALTALD